MSVGVVKRKLVVYQTVEEESPSLSSLLAELMAVHGRHTAPYPFLCICYVSVSCDPGDLGRVPAEDLQRG